MLFQSGPWPALVFSTVNKPLAYVHDFEIRSKLQKQYRTIYEIQENLNSEYYLKLGKHQKLDG